MPEVRRRSARQPRVRDDAPSANTSAAMLRLANAYLGDGDAATMRLRYGRLAAVLFVMAAAYGLVVIRTTHAHLLAQWVVLGLGLFTAAVLLVLPWRRLPDASTVVPALWAVVLLSVGVGVVAGQLAHYACLYAAIFAYTGLTQRPGITGRTGMIALLGVGIAATWGRQDSGSLEVVVAIIIGTCVGEIISLSFAWHRHTRSELLLLHEALRRLVAADTESEAASIVASVARQLLHSDGAITMLSVRRGSTLFVGRGGTGPGVNIEQARIDVATTVSGTARCIAEGRPIFISDARTDPELPRHLLDKVGARSVLCVPVPGEGGWVGSITLWWTTPQRALDPFAGQALDLLTCEAGQVLERVREVEMLDAAATTDPLTGVGNRRAFDYDLQRLPVGGTVIVLDLDAFKLANDAHGHGAGDMVLTQFAAMITMGMREGDAVARLGGDEFALLLPSPDSALVARSVLDRLHHRWPAPLGVQFSAGVAQRHPGEDPASTLVRADAALYDEKHRGRGTRDRRVGVTSA